MNCEECKQRPATVHLTKILNGQKTEMHLCEECARQHDEIPFNFGFNMEPNFSIQKFLAGLLGGGTPGAGAAENVEEASADAPQCPNCSLTYGQFGKVGRFGCSQCYQSFAPQLEPLLRRVQGNSHHTGKVPLRGGGTAGQKREIDQLRHELHDAINTEAYERAAVLRDRIRALQGEIAADDQRLAVEDQQLKG